MNRKISVVIGTRNPRPDYFHQAVAGCVGVDELVIVNDASDLPVELPEDSLLVKFPTVKVINLEKNAGAMVALDIGTRESTGDFIAHMSDDDYYDEDNFPKILDVVRSTRAHAVIFPCRNFGPHAFESEFFGDEPHPTFEKNLYKNAVYGSCFFSREMYEFVGFQVKYGSDWDFWNRALKSGFPFEYVPVVGAHFRVWERSHLRSAVDSQGWDAVRQAVIDSGMGWNRVWSGKGPGGC